MITLKEFEDYHSKVEDKINHLKEQIESMSRLPSSAFPDFRTAVTSVPGSLVEGKSSFK